MVATQSGDDSASRRYQMSLTIQTETPISKITSREVALEKLLPKIFGILWEKGYKTETGGHACCSAHLDGDLELIGNP
jgi:hypothetical protein